MNKNSYFKEQVFFQMDKFIAKGYAERIPSEEVHGKGKWWLPLHPVTHPKKPGKVRITHDAAAKSEGKSLIF